MVAVLDHSCSANLAQATTFDGTLRYKQFFFKYFRGLVKMTKCDKEKHFVQDLAVFLQKSSGEYYKLPRTSKLVKNLGLLKSHIKKRL